MQIRSCLFIALAIVLLSCGGKKEAGKETPKTVNGSGSAPVAATADTVEIFVDDTSVAKVTADQIAKWPRLDALVPQASARLGTWMSVSLASAKPTPSEVQKPSANYPDMIPAVFPGEGGKPAFGMFDPVELAKHGKPALREDAITQIRIKVNKEGRGGDHQGGASDGADPTKLVVVIKTAAGEKQLTGAQILALPREPMPGSEDTKGWRVGALLAAAGVTTYTKVVLIDANGMSLPLEKKELDNKDTVPFIKLNKQGSLRFRLLKKQGDGWQAAGDLRALATIQVK